jgi:hypothetical protein
MFISLNAETHAYEAEVAAVERDDDAAATTSPTTQVIRDYHAWISRTTARYFGAAPSGLVTITGWSEPCRSIESMILGRWFWHMTCQELTT